jgi:hypothetical protein
MLLVTIVPCPFCFCGEERKTLLGLDSPAAKRNKKNTEDLYYKVRAATADNSLLQSSSAAKVQSSVIGRPGRFVPNACYAGRAHMHIILH